MSPRVLRIARGRARSSGACNLHWCQMSAVCAVVWSDAGSTALRCAQIIGHALRQWHARPSTADRAARIAHGAIGGTRLHPAGSTFNHLWLAGDWTLNGLNAGCAEAAITSGMLASRALAGEPRDATFTDYFGQAGQPPAEATPA